jgi:hypothetical protein
MLRVEFIDIIAVNVPHSYRREKIDNPALPFAQRGFNGPKAFLRIDGV